MLRQPGAPAFDDLILHIGIQKTGTTFVQNAIFPYWQGIHYTANDKLEVLLRVPENKPLLVSREGLSGQNWADYETRERSIARLARMFPNARTMLSFRKHSGYIVSSYCQYLQRGGYLPFEQYFDPVSDTGYMKIEDFRFGHKVEAVERHFGTLPFIFFQEELFRDLPQLLSDMQQFIGGQAPDPNSIRDETHNQSVKYHPAKLLRFLNRYSRSELNPQGKLPLYHRRLTRMKLDPRSICQYWLSFAPKRPMIDETTKQRIEALYRDDWEAVQKVAGQRRSLHGS